jgi:hypothetical protein
MKNELIRQYKGSTLPKLIEHHIKSQTKTQLENAVFEMYTKLPEPSREIVSDFTLHYIQNWFQPNIVDVDLSLVFTHAVEEIDKFSKEFKLNLSENQMIDVFIIMVLRTSFFASTEPQFRKLLAIKKGWFS